MTFLAFYFFKVERYECPKNLKGISPMLPHEGSWLNSMARNRGIMSDRLKFELAQELGVADEVARTGDFGSVSSRNCGNLVKLAIERAERSLVY